MTAPQVTRVGVFPEIQEECHLRDQHVGIIMGAFASASSTAIGRLQCSVIVVAVDEIQEARRRRHFRHFA